MAFLLNLFDLLSYGYNTNTKNTFVAFIILFIGWMTGACERSLLTRLFLFQFMARIFFSSDWGFKRFAGFLFLEGIIRFIEWPGFPFFLEVFGSGVDEICRQIV